MKKLLILMFCMILVLGTAIVQGAYGDDITYEKVRAYLLNQDIEIDSEIWNTESNWEICDDGLGNLSICYWNEAIIGIATPTLAQLPNQEDAEVVVNSWNEANIQEPAYEIYEANGTSVFEINTILIAEEIYTQSLTVVPDKNYTALFDDRSTLENKDTHYAKGTIITDDGTEFNVLDAEERVESLEGFATELWGYIKELFTKQTELENRVNALETENALIKSELCKKDNTYSWCIGGVSP